MDPAPTRHVLPSFRFFLILSCLSILFTTPAGAQEMMPTASGWSSFAPRSQTAPVANVTQGSTGYALNVYGNGVPNVYGGWRTRIQGLQGGNYYRFRARALPVDIASSRESVTIILRWRGAFGDEVSPDYVWDYRSQADGSLQFDRTIQAPAGTNAVDIELVLQWAPTGRVSFDALSFMPAAAPAARTVRVAAVYYRPSGTASGRESVQLAAQYAEQVGATNHPDIMVLGEMLNVIGAPGSLDSKAETIPGPSTDIVASVARSYNTYIVFGLLEREGNLLYNASILVNRSGEIVGKYRKVQVPLPESSAGIGPGNSISVFDTDFGRIAMLICHDVSFPEPTREAALKGAELILVPFWGGKSSLVRARGAEHGMYVAISGYDYPSEIVDPLGNVLDTVNGINGPPDVAIADIDLRRRFRENWLGDWRDISSKERRTSPYTAGTEPPEPPPPPPPPVDQTPPSVSIASPASGATVSGTVSVTANASDNVGVASVRFFLDGVQLGGDDTSAPYAISWDTTTTGNGSHTVMATAFDAAGNSASSAIPVNVSNGTGAGPVTWTSLVKVTATGSTLKKTSGCDGCQDAGAVSVQTISSGNGYVEFTVPETTTQRVIGLSNGNTDTTRADIDFALNFWGGGTVDVRENGLYKFAETTYVAGDVFRIAVEAGAVNFYKNGVRLYRSTVAPVYPLLVDTSFFTLNGTFSSVVLGKTP